MQRFIYVLKKYEANSNRDAVLYFTTSEILPLCNFAEFCWPTT